MAIPFKAPGALSAADLHEATGVTAIFDSELERHVVTSPFTISEIDKRLAALGIKVPASRFSPEVFPGPGGKGFLSVGPVTQLRELAKVQGDPIPFKPLERVGRKTTVASQQFFDLGDTIDDIRGVVNIGKEVIGFFRGDQVDTRGSGLTGLVATNCPEGFKDDGAGGCAREGFIGFAQRFVEGGSSGMAFDAVNGRFGTGNVPVRVQSTRLACPPGMVLGKDNICYSKGSGGVSPTERKWNPGSRPLLTGGERRILTKAAQLQRKVAKLSNVVAPCSTGRKRKPKTKRKGKC